MERSSIRRCRHVFPGFLPSFHLPRGEVKAAPRIESHSSPLTAYPPAPSPGDGSAMGSHDTINNMWCPQYIEDTALELSVREPAAYYERQAWKHGGRGDAFHSPPLPLPLGCRW